MNAKTATTSLISAAILAGAIFAAGAYFSPEPTTEVGLRTVIVEAGTAITKQKIGMLSEKEAKKEVDKAFDYAVRYLRERGKDTSMLADPAIRTPFPAEQNLRYLRLILKK